MIAQLTPSIRATTLTSAMLILAFGFLASANAADKPLPQTEREARQRGLSFLEDELAKREVDVKKMEQSVDGLKQTLQIVEADEPGPNKPGTVSEGRHRLESLRFEAMADYNRSETSYRFLTNLPKADLKKALPTVVTDPCLIALINNQNAYEQDLTKLVDTYGSNHPEVKRAMAVLEKTNRQIDERVDGMLLGLRIKVQSEKARWDNLEAELERVRKSEVQKAIDRRPYYQAKRELENLQFIREKLAMRILQEKIEAAMPK